MLQDTAKSSKMILQVHYELVFEIKEDKVKEYAKKIKDIMENVVKLKVSLEVKVEVGDNWQEMEEIKINNKTSS